jgi:hypothetical protein
MPISGTQTVLAPIAPNSANDAYATHLDEYGRGGFRSITTGGSGTATNAQIGAQIKPDRRKVGMLVYDVSTAKYYRCSATAGDGTYAVEDFGTSGGSVTSVGLSMPSGFTVNNSPIVNSGDLTVTTTLSGVIKGTGTGFSTATASSDGTAGDYAAAVHTQGVGTVTGVTSSRLLGRYSAGTGATQQIQIGSGLNLDASGVLTSEGLGGTLTSVTASAPLSATSAVEGDSVAISHNLSGVVAGSAGSATTVPVIEVNSTGHVTSLGVATISGFLPTAGGTLTGDLTLAGTGSDLSVGGNLTVSGDLVVQGETTTINTTTLAVEDRNVELGKVSTPSDATADGGGITLKGSTDKLFRWIDSTDAWTSSEHLELATGKQFRIDGVNVLSKTGLGSTVLASSLTSVGTIGAGTWQGTAVGLAYGGTGSNLSAVANGSILKKSGGALIAATAGTDYLDDSSTIDGGGY